MTKTITIPAPISGNLAIAMRTTGILCLLKAAFAVVFLYLTGGPHLEGFSTFGVVFYVLLPLMIGAYLFNLPDSPKGQRAKLLEQRDAAVEKGHPVLYVEKPADPAMVTMSLWLGSIALLTLPILFGSAAVVTGIIGVAQGHRKAYCGIILGTLVLGAWGAIIYYLTLHIR